MKLKTRSVNKEFDGLKALTDVSLTLGQGEILAVIGPNGSGKTTLANVISGVLRPTAGTVHLGDEVMSGRPANRVAQAGIARTFQNVRLFEEMTVLENVLVAASASPRNGALRNALSESRSAIASLGLAHYEVELVGHVPFVLQRRVELARAVATKPHFLLLDEPAAGLNDRESDELLQALLDIRERLGCGILVIDHDLRLIMRVTERIHVLNEGVTLAEGTPEEIRRNPEVIKAYLGSENGGAERGEGVTPSEKPSPNHISSTEENNRIRR